MTTRNPTNLKFSKVANTFSADFLKIAGFRCFRNETINDFGQGLWQFGFSGCFDVPRFTNILTIGSSQEDINLQVLQNKHYTTWLLLTSNLGLEPLVVP